MATFKFYDYEQSCNFFLTFQRNEKRSQCLHVLRLLILFICLGDIIFSLTAEEIVKCCQKMPKLYLESTGKIDNTVYQ